MSGLVLKITELDAADPYVFAFSIAERSAPRGDWEQPIEVSVQATYYPDSDGVPTEQVTSWRRGEQTIEGVWDDRHMGAGKAADTLLAFDRMVQGGNRVSIEYGRWGFVGRITNYTPNPIREDLIAWRITFTPHYRMDQPPAKRSGGLVGQRPPRTPDDYYQSVRFPFDAADATHAAAEAWRLAGTVHGAVDERVTEVRKVLGAVQTVLDLRTDERTNTADTIRSVADLMSRVEARTQDVLDLVIDTNSDDVEAWDDPLNVLGYEAWSRGVAADMRITGLRAHLAALELARRVDTSVLAVYRPRRNESLYSIARKFYGNALLWREISERNRLQYTNLTGTEALVIPRLGKAA